MPAHLKSEEAVCAALKEKVIMSNLRELAKHGLVYDPCIAPIRKEAAFGCRHSELVCSLSYDASMFKAKRTALSVQDLRHVLL